MNDPRFIELLDRYLDRGLAAADKARLEAILRASDEARSAFWERARLHSALRLRTQRLRGQRLARIGPREPTPLRRMPPQPPPFRLPAPRPVAKAPRWNRWSVGATVVLSLAAVLVFNTLRRSAAENARPARVVYAPVPGGDTRGWRTGDVLPRGGPLKLGAGVLELEFARGTQVAVEGPAHVEVTDSRKIHLIEGRLSAKVPPRARGFTVTIPGGQIVVRGTRFGVAVEPDGVSSVHVFEGKLRVAAAGVPPLDLSAGEGMTARAGQVVRVRADETQFPRVSRVLSNLLVHGEFEPGTRVDPRYVPKEFASWSGDAAKIVGLTAGATPRRGAGMLSFTPPGADRETIKQWQLVDLRPVQQAALGAPVEATFGAWFNRAAGATSHKGCAVALGAFRGKPAQAARLWGQRLQAALALDESALKIDLDPATWERIEAKINVPPNADFLLAQVAANPTKETDPFKPGRNAHFADSAELELRILPAPSSSVRAALR